ncbi:MAG: hypothetical protein H9897_02335 [Candidatus Ureaplasma intestinipullorum]|uniref:Aminoglycoside phosphotransferase domain-containing protein n=1 Tax=Candidatus Ureaplasma intestinipullorum TaxID=2838770 RepID=A0A9E2KWX1_9BACT|nr:hypothetical protein [Candidatus Ureaplasma intestinipullorum]
MITKKCNNSLLLDYLAFLNKSNFKYVYKINKTSNGYSYKYIIGKTYKNAVELSYLKLYKIAKILKNLHILSFRYGYIHNFKQDEIICHTDISPLNIIFNFLGWPKKIIDFDECEILNYIYDVIFLLCTCINIGDWNKINFKTKAKKVLFFISQYKDKKLIDLIFKNIDFFYNHTIKKYQNRNIQNLDIKIKWLDSIKRFFKYWYDCQYRL